MILSGENSIVYKSWLFPEYVIFLSTISKESIYPLINSLLTFENQLNRVTLSIVLLQNFIFSIANCLLLEYCVDGLA